MWNFFTKKQQEKLQNYWVDKIQNAYNQSSIEEQNKLKETLQNTQNQNFTASEYNLKARENWETDWQNAYRRDILWINDNNQVQTQNTQNTQNQTFIWADEIKKWNEQIEQTQKNLENFNNQLQNLQENNWLQNQEQQKVENTQTTQNIDYKNWNVESWKGRWSSKDELENAIEQKYWTIASWKDDWSLEAVVNGEKFSWKIDQNWNPVKTSLWSVNQGDINKNKFLWMIQGGSSVSELNDFIYKNNLQDNPDVKNQLKQKYISDFEKPILQKYQNYSLEELHQAIKNGEIFPWTDVFKKLPQASAYEQYKWSFAIIDAEKDDDFSAINSATDIQKIVDSSLSNFFDISGIQKFTEDFKNDTEIKGYREEIAQSQKKIADYKRQLKEVWEEVRAQMWMAPESMIQAEISRRAEAIYRWIETETALLNSNASLIADRRQDFEAELGLLKYSDEMKKNQYLEWLELYKYNRDKMDDFKKMELENRNQELAFQRQLKSQKEMFELEQKYKDKGWTYKVWTDWSLIYIVDWVAQKVKFDDWEVLFTENTEENTIQTKFNDDWTFSIFSISKDWKNVNVRTLDMNWNLVSWVPDRMYNAISSIWDWKQCWEWVNDFLEKMWWKRIFWNLYEQKLSKKDTETPVVWSIAIYNPAQIWSENYKYWHVWIVTWVSPDWQTVYITDWNADGKSKKKTENRAVKLSEITWSGGGFHLPFYLNKNVAWSWNVSWNNVTTVTWNENENTSWNSEDLATARSIAKWKSNINNYPVEERAKYNLIIEQLQKKWEFYLSEDDIQSKKIKKIIDDLDNILTNEVRTLDTLSWTMRWWRWFWQKDNDIRNIINNIVDSNVLQTLIDAKANGATFGALSNQELEMLKWAASVLWKWWYESAEWKKDFAYHWSEEQFKKELKEILEQYKNIYSKMTWISSNPAWI